MPSITLLRMFAILLATCAMFSPSAPAQTIYVNGTCGDNSWTGSSPICQAPNGPKRTISAGINTAPDGGEVVIADGVYGGAGNTNLTVNTATLTIRSMNGAANCVIDGGGDKRGFYLNSSASLSVAIDGLTFRNCFGTLGGAIRATQNSMDLLIHQCHFEMNSAEVGGAINFNTYYAAPGGVLTVVGSSFVSNGATAGAGAIFAAYLDQAVVFNCEFRNNLGASLGGAAVFNTVPAAAVNCVVALNVSDFSTGGLAFLGYNSSVINLSLYGNSAVHDGAIYGIFQQPVYNCISWNNSPVQISGDVELFHCDIQGGWSGPGSNNIDADPLFVQPASGDLRLSFGSPCIDMGDTAALPADQFDLDGDGDTDEPLPLDLAGAPRVQNGVVDIGAYEGEYEALPPMAATDDLDLLDIEILIPMGGSFDPIAAPAAIVTNTSGPDDSSYMITQYAADIHPGAAGYSDLSYIMATKSSLQPGQLFARLFISFEQSALGGAAPFDVDLTTFDPALNAWTIGVARNSQNSPGYDSPIGDRITIESTGLDYGLTSDPGDYGVFWNPALQKGFVWANVDVTGDFGVGISLCHLDCAPNNGDGLVDATDVAAILSTWGQVSGDACDFDANGIIGPFDLAQALAAWGPCPSASSGLAGAAPSPSSASPVDRQQVAANAPNWGPCAEGSPCEGDFNSDRRIDSHDLASLLAAWGDCDDCPADLDRSGKVDRADLDRLLGRSR